MDGVWHEAPCWQHAFEAPSWRVERASHSCSTPACRLQSVREQIPGVDLQNALASATHLFAAGTNSSKRQEQILREENRSVSQVEENTVTKAMFQRALWLPFSLCFG